MIIDYSTSRPSISQLRAAGVTSVGRYIGWDSVPGFRSIGKNLTRFEAQALLTNGISIFLAFEYAPDAAAKGASQGRADGNLAAQQLAALGAPPDMAVYFCVDFDLGDYAPSLPDTKANAAAKLGPVGNYFRTINELGKPYSVGVYGGYYAVKRVLDAGLASHSWQTVAWSRKQEDPRTNIYQLAGRSPIAGADVDLRQHVGSSGDWGQWPRPGSPVPVPTPSVQYLTTAQTGSLVGKLPVLSQGMNDNNLPFDYVGRLQAILNDVYGYTVTVNGTYDAATVDAVKQLQARYNLTQDGICGALTWAPVITGEN